MIWLGKIQSIVNDLYQSQTWTASTLKTNCIWPGYWIKSYSIKMIFRGKLFFLRETPAISILIFFTFLGDIDDGDTSRWQSKICWCQFWDVTNIGNFTSESSPIFIHLRYIQWLFRISWVDQVLNLMLWIFDLIRMSQSQLFLHIKHRLVFDWPMTDKM